MGPTRIEAPLIATSRAPLAPEGVVIPRHRSKSAYGVLQHLHRHWLMGVPCAELNTVHLAAYRDERGELGSMLQGHTLPLWICAA
ncbi:MAG: hypothetical protein VKI42_06735, partial [Synechococcaceae cyanobacterium]|nr:hypothetical protein [Synechococcaceae cyanobacterium]